MKVSFHKWHPQLIKKNVLAYEIIHLLFGELKYFAQVMFLTFYVTIYKVLFMYAYHVAAHVVIILYIT